MTTTEPAPWPQLTGNEPCRAPKADPEDWTGTPKQRLNGKRACLSSCPESTRAQCLAWALDHPSRAGSAIWAGTTLSDRRRLRAERRAASTG
ncbi:MULTISPECIES: WhiB family transcriptional regulator [unclassified Streptomyces]|uniref:WhiB family transcriptional regulator n=1 Tax=unclassified Streptomyces TaxID=2593676 RepID=UPI001BE9A1D0|nr:MULTISPECIES: WhiB family transcriptional regulator [unclassified Streptomyces]MBT2406878.1 WhiB family transcriptional regulator [Streptomyces sp. ISL-21]MBT2613087.1 WhiB family transcriptional regulator [Streptomyces sp. ISL-87]